MVTDEIGATRGTKDEPEVFEAGALTCSLPPLSASQSCRKQRRGTQPRQSSMASRKKNAYANQLLIFCANVSYFSNTVTDYVFGVKSHLSAVCEHRLCPPNLETACKDALRHGWTLHSRQATHTGKSG